MYSLRIHANGQIKKHCALRQLISLRVLHATELSVEKTVNFRSLSRCGHHHYHHRSGRDQKQGTTIRLRNIILFVIMCVHHVQSGTLLETIDAIRIRSAAHGVNVACCIYSAFCILPDSEPGNTFFLFSVDLVTRICNEPAKRT